MRILVVSPFVPHPGATHGGAVYLGALVEALAQRADVALAALTEPAGSAEPVPVPAGVRRSYLVPHAHLRDLRGAARVLHKARMIWLWGRGKPVLPAKFWSPALAVTLGRARIEFQPDACLLEFAVMAQYLPYLHAVPTILTDHESGDPLPVAIGPGSLGGRRDARLWARYVHRHYRAAQSVQTLTRPDAERLAARIDRPVDVRPPAVPIPPNATDPATAPARAVFLGNYLHRPNPEAAEFLAREVWPRVLERHPTAELWLAGPDPGRELAALEGRPGLRILGQVEDLATLFGSCRLLVAPVLSGAGVRIKILTAMAHGVAVVANELGLRGIDAPQDAARRAETPDALAAAVCELLEHPERARALGRAARDWVARDLSAEALAVQQLRRLQALVGR